MKRLCSPIAYLAMLAVAGLAFLSAASRRSLRDEAGNVITDNLAFIVFGVVTIVAVAALLKVLGANVIGWVTTQLGV